MERTVLILEFELHRPDFEDASLSYSIFVNSLISGRWQAPAAVLSPKKKKKKSTVTRGPEGPESGRNMRVRGPEGPEDELREVPVLVLASAIICFSQLSSKSRISWVVLKILMSAKNHENCSGPLYLQYEYRVKKLVQFMDHIKSYATSKFRKNEVFVSQMYRHPDPPLSLETIFSLKSPMFKGQ